MTRLLSQKFRFLTFACIFLLAYVHGYNLALPYLAPYSLVEEPLTLTAFFQYLFANGLLRFRIPMLFLISGYLYATYDNIPYPQRTRKRMVTLLVPYFLWSAWSLLFTFLLQQHPYTANIVYTAAIDQFGENQPYAEMPFQGILNRWVWAPPAYQLWFIFVLFVYNLLYPIIRWMLVKIPWVWLSIAFVFWFGFFNLQIIEGQGLFFFSLGAFFKLRRYAIEREPRWFSLGIAWILFVGLCIIKTFMAFELQPNSFNTAITLSILYNLASLVGIFAIWYSVDPIAKKAMSNPLFKQYSGYSFFIYGLHVPLLPYAMTWAKLTAGHLPFFRLLSYLFLPAVVMLFCLLVARVMHKMAPGIYGWLSGGRGF